MHTTTLQHTTTLLSNANKEVATQLCSKLSGELNLVHTTILLTDNREVATLSQLFFQHSREMATPDTCYDCSLHAFAILIVLPV